MTAAASSIALLLLAVGPSAGFRTIRTNRSAHSAGAVGIVDQLYTFGAPMVGDDIIENPASSSGCFAGYRVIREETKFLYKVDIVVPLLWAASYNHPKMKTLKVNTEKSDIVEACGWKVPALTFRTASVPLHSRVEYVSMSTAKAGAAASLALNVSYNENEAEVASLARRAGWGLVDTAFGYGDLSWLPVIGKAEVSHLFQHPQTLDCMITFEGSDSLENWLDNLNFGKSSFCSLPTRTHSGFQDAMRIITAGSDFQQKIRPKLPSCRSVRAVGHSLGGAIASLFAACANNYGRAGGDADFRNITWTKGTPTKMSYK